MADFEAKESKQIHWVRYDPAALILEVDFRGKDGTKSSTYAYADVPEETYAQFNASESKGRFFALHIRNGFKATKIWPK